VPTPKRKPTKPYTLVILLDHDDRAALEEAAAIEKLNKSDSVRRAIRAYARKLRSQIAAAS
jgi:uncharacterized protein (DUF1778 family)